MWPELTSKTDFEVRLKPLSYIRDPYDRPHRVELNPSIGQLVTKVVINNHLTIYEPLGIVGSRYGLAPNAPIYKMLCDSAEAALPTEALQNIELYEESSGNGAFTRIELRFPNLGESIRQLNNSTTQLIFKLNLINSFNGSGSIRVIGGAVDTWCTNGAPFTEISTKAERHTSGFTPERFEKFIKEQCKKFTIRVEVWQRWAEKRITAYEAEQILNAGGMSGRKIKTIMQQFEIEAEQRGSSIWAMYSALTAYSSHESVAPVRNSNKVDNVAVTLNTREREVSRLVNSPQFLELAA
tara:strand:- start:27 stop:914 length:888 start_codon:yes stop_codon:yes gene_type:complete